jgi:hypothetical protein
MAGMKTLDKKPRRLPLDFRTIEYWRNPNILDCDISDMKNLADQSPAPEIDLCREIEDSLLEHGQAPVQELVLALEKIFRRHALREVAEQLRDKLQAGDTPQAVAIRSLLLGRPESARAEAKRLGVSHTAILKARRKARAGFQKVSG